MNLGDKIRQIREAKGLTQEQVADLLGMSQAGYSKIERNETDLPMSRFIQLAQVLSVEPAEILADTTVKNVIFFQANAGSNQHNTKISMATSGVDVDVFAEYNQQLRCIWHEINQIKELLKHQTTLHPFNEHNTEVRN